MRLCRPVVRPDGDSAPLVGLEPRGREVEVNAGVFQLFGVANHLMAKESAELIGDVNADILRAMSKDRQIIAVSNEKAMSARLPDYLMDAPFAGQFDPNPMFEPDPGPTKRRTSRAR
jgi:type IV secretion system protein VirD4